MIAIVRNLLVHDDRGVTSNHVELESSHESIVDKVKYVLNKDYCIGFLTGNNQCPTFNCKVTTILAILIHFGYRIKKVKLGPYETYILINDDMAFVSKGS